MRVLGLLLFLCSVVVGAHAASFDCSKSTTFVEKHICEDAKLSKLDDRMGEFYKDAIAKSAAPDALREEQRAWLKARDACKNSACIRRSYEERQAKLSESYGFKPFDLSSGGEAPRQTICSFADVKFPEDFAVFATGAYSGRKIQYQLDQSGHEGTQIDVAVNYTAKPVVLMLGAYEPTIWNIGWSPKTRIVAVLASGYHRQVIAGLDPGVPTIISSYDNKGACGYFYLSTDKLETLNPLSRRLFGRPVDLVYPASNGKAVVGDALPVGVTLVTSTVATPESFYDRKAPLAGPAGLEDAVQRGLLRRATQADAQAWADAIAANVPDRDVPPVAGQGPTRPRARGTYNGYVVLQAFTFPAGLYGGNSAAFYVPKGVPAPAGNPGHSSVYDFNSLDCRGPMCRR